MIALTNSLLVILRGVLERTAGIRGEKLIQKRRHELQRRERQAA